MSFNEPSFTPPGAATGHQPGYYPASPAVQPPAGYPGDASSAGSYPSGGYAPGGHAPTRYGPAGYPPSGYPYPADLIRPSAGAAPGKNLGIAGFILAFLGPLTVLGLVLSIVAAVQSRRARVGNGLAWAGICVGIAGTALVVLFAVMMIIGFSLMAETCAQLGPGVHQVGNTMVTCRA